MSPDFQPGLISIMMPVYNAEKFIEQAIESVLAQTYPNFELIIVNDGSTDRTPELAVKYSDPRIRVIHQSNGGESIARNTALRHMHGEYVAFLDADDMFLERHIELGIAYLNAHPDCDGVYSDGYHFDAHGNRSQSLSSNRRGPFEGFIFGEVARASDVFGPPICVILRRGIITRFHLEYDPEIVIGPDWDFFIQYAELGRFGSVPDFT
ncbi:MAG TPA: glycosyltransferase family A protein, partial [Anaerolineales bacterium]|nr:glycosyltransferase family A protein [Anaerolineales bacterium]